MPWDLRVLSKASRSAVNFDASIDGLWWREGRLSIQRGAMGGPLGSKLQQPLIVFPWKRATDARNDPLRSAEKSHASQGLVEHAGRDAVRFLERMGVVAFVVMAG